MEKKSKVLCCADWRKFKPQQTALSGGSLLILNSGIHFVYSFYEWTNNINRNKSDVSWTKSISTTLISFAVIAWFAGSIVGFILAPLSSRTFNKKVIYLIGNGLVLLAAVLFIILPKNFYIVLSGRFIAGIGYGLGYVALVRHYGEVVNDNRRGRVGSSIHLFLLKGGLIASPGVIRYFTQTDFAETRMDINRFLGLVSLIFSIVAIIMTVLFYKESPIELLRRGNEDKAENMMMLLFEASSREEIAERFNELKCMADEDKFSNAYIFEQQNKQRLLVVLMLRFSFVLTFNYALKFIHITIIEGIQHDSSFGISAAAGIKTLPIEFILNVIHTFTVVYALFSIDSRGRRCYFLISGFGTSIIFVILGAFGASRGFEFTDVGIASHLILLLLFVAFEIFSALGMGLTSNIYSTEAFEAMKAPGSVAFTCIFEHFLQISLVIWTETIVEHSRLLDVVLLLSSGLILAAMSTYLFLNLPETRHLSLLDARNSFKH